jgi:hypothetical protein
VKASSLRTEKIVFQCQNFTDFLKFILCYVADKDPTFKNILIQKMGEIFLLKNLKMADTVSCHIPHPK